MHTYKPNTLYRNACDYASITYIDETIFADTDGQTVPKNEEGHQVLADVLIEEMVNEN